VTYGGCPRSYGGAERNIPSLSSGPIMGSFNVRELSRPTLPNHVMATSFNVDRMIEISLSQCLGSGFRSHNPKQVPLFLHTQNLEVKLYHNRRTIVC